MLQLQTKSNDICRISKLLVKYNIKANITDSVITLDGDVSDELLTQLCGSININAVQNFISQEPLHVPKEASFIKSEEHIPIEVVDKPKSVEVIVVDETEKIETTQATPTLSHHLSDYDLIYSDVKHGQAYWCDLGEASGSEQSGIRPVIVVSNIKAISFPTVIVIPCSTSVKVKFPNSYSFSFSPETMLDYHDGIDTRRTSALATKIQTVNKFQLREFIGTMTPEFMKKMQNIIDTVLCLNRDVKTVEKKVYVDRPVAKKAKVDPEVPKEHKDVNIVQIQLLSFVDINELLKISQSYSTDEVKAQRILELFGFDFKRNGVQYLLKAIITSPKDAYFNLETLSESVSRTEGIEKEEVKRLIVARVKETFGFRKAPTIDFIRFVNNFLVKQEEA